MRKAIDVVLSCKTNGQLIVARRYIDLALKRRRLTESSHTRLAQKINEKNQELLLEETVAKNVLYV